MRGSVTIRDVAREAGVSIATVSRVVNGSANVKEETRKKVEAAIKVLGYAPNVAAQMLSSSESVAPDDRVRGLSGRNGVVVFGNLMVELVFDCLTLPKAGVPGEGTGLRVYPGGRGANQAVACARAGVRSVMIGRVGDDPFLPLFEKSFLESGVRGDFVAVTPGTASGYSLVLRSEAGGTYTVGSRGAGNMCSVQDVKAARSAMKEAKLLLLQMEVPAETITFAALQAKETGLIVLLDPTAPGLVSEELCRCLDVIMPDQREAEVLTGRKIVDVRGARQAIPLLLAKGAKSAVIKMGPKGVVYGSAASSGYVPGHAVSAVDVSASGDAFAGALAAALCEGKGLSEACRLANVAGAISVTRTGSQRSMPWRHEIYEMLSSATYRRT